jgi:hypothetical protein
VLIIYDDFTFNVTQRSVLCDRDSFAGMSSKHLLDMVFQLFAALVD